MKDRFPEAVVKANVRVLGGSGWAVYTRPDSPEDCCVIEHYEKAFYCSRHDIGRWIAMLQCFKQAVDKAYPLPEENE